MVTNTSSPSYWAPLRPRIRIYEFEDSTYASPLYTYDAFTDEGSEVKPIGLSFSSQISSVGTFSIEIEDSASVLDPDVYMRGNRVVIECSKDGVTWETAFKALIRSSVQKLYATTGRNLVLDGYSYLIRLNERLLNTIQESALIGADYNRTDSNMFTNNLVNELLTDDSAYIYSVDDTQLYSVFKTNNIASSPIVEWVPRLDAQLITVNAALSRILEFSNGLVMLNPADDQLTLYTADLVTPATGIFLITNQMNQNADDADYTMYPLGPYDYDISYDFVDCGSRLIASIGNAGACPPEQTLIPETLVGDSGQSSLFWSFGLNLSRVLAPAVQFSTALIRNLAIAVLCVGDNHLGASARARIYENMSADGYGIVGGQVGSDFTLWVNGIQGTPFPSVDTHTIVMSMLPGDTGPTVDIAKWYYLAINMLHTMNDTKYVGWRTGAPVQTDHFFGRYAVSHDNGSSFVLGSTVNYLPGDQDPAHTERIFHKWKWDLAGGNTLACGGSQATAGADPVFAVAHDKNLSGRLGVVEKVITSIPTHVKKLQTLNEYLFNKLYFSAKPRFTFDYPSLSMPDKLPKAGDICAHVDTRVGIGLRNAPIQTGVINQIQYSFQQRGVNDVLGLRKLALTTTGIKRGSY